MPQFIKKYSIKPEVFEIMREEVLSAIEEIKEKHESRFSTMTHSDYMNQRNGPFPIYHNIVKSVVEPFLTDYAQHWGCREAKLKEMWFCEYRNGADFNWHTHEGSNVSAVLHLVGDKEYSTQIMGSEIRMEEGEIVIFPAMLLHRGPKIRCQCCEKFTVGKNIDILGSIITDK